MSVRVLHAAQLEFHGDRRITRRRLVQWLLAIQPLMIARARRTLGHSPFGFSPRLPGADPRTTLNITCPSTSSAGRRCQWFPVISHASVAEAR